MNHQTQVEAVVNSLAGLTRRDALKVLTAALSLIISPAGQVGDELSETVKRSNAHLLRRRVSGGCKISRCPEMQAYIDNLDHYSTLGQLRKELIARFGKEKAPSKSALHRYLQKILKQQEG